MAKNGKGSKRRPSNISKKEYDKRFDATFKKKPLKLKEDLKNYDKSKNDN